MSNKTVLLAGGAGYIASHTAIELMEAGYDVISADCYYNSKPEVFNRIEKITGVKVKNYNLDKIINLYYSLFDFLFYCGPFQFF